MLDNSQIKQYAKACLFPTAGIENNFHVYDKIEGYTVPFILFPRQKALIDAYEKHRFNLVIKSRQAGVSTVTMAYMANKAIFCESEPETILIVSPRLDLAANLLKILKDFIDQMPRCVWGPNYSGINSNKSIYLKDTKHEIRLPNGSIIKACGSSIDSMRGFRASIVYMDEVAYLNKAAEIYGALMGSIATGGKIILASTPNGKDELFYKCYDNAINGYNVFNVIEMKWYMDSRYNRGLKWIKNKEVVDEHLFSEESFKIMIDDGWKPTSPWYHSMKQSMNNNLKYFAQELDCSFEKW